jgi:hypothetical protein
MNDYEADDIEGLLGTLEYDEPEADDLTEARGRSRNFSRLPTVPKGGLSPPRPQGQAVTQMQLQALATRVDGRLQKLDTKTGVLERRINTVNTEQGRLAAALKKETAARTKGEKEQAQITQLLTILPLLTPRSSRTITAATNGLQQNDKVLLDTDGISALLPILLISGGLGGGGGSGGLFGGGGDSSIFPLILLLALQPGGLGSK